uniref:Lhy1 n=1 Tax=Rhizophora mucronata TaxID=61149 RepID=A0A2P2LU17_RHIMU
MQHISYIRTYIFGVCELISLVVLGRISVDCCRFLSFCSSFAAVIVVVVGVIVSNIQVFWGSETTASSVVFYVATKERRFMLYPLLVGEDSKQR